MESTLLERRARAGQLVDTIALAGLTVVLSVPFLVSGAGFYREDWKALSDARTSGWWAAGSVVWARRPLGAVLYALVYGGIGDHPRAAFAAVLAVNVAVTVMLLAVARRLLDRWTAAAVVFVFVLLPSRSSLVHWVNGIALESGLLLLLVGAWLLLRAVERHGSVWPAVAVIVASTMVYDPTVVAGALVLVAVPRLLTGRYSRDLVAAAALLLVVRIPWSILTASGQPELIPLNDAFSSNFGWGVVSPRPAWLLLQCLVLVGIALAGIRVLRGHGERDREGLVLAGLVIFVTGMVPFLQTGADVDFLGIGDRANFIAAVGAACVFVGIIRMLRTPTVAATLLVLGLGFACLPLRTTQDHRWEQTWSASNDLLDRARHELASGHQHLWYGPRIIDCGGVEGISGDASDALHVWTGNRHATLEFDPARPAGHDHVDTGSITCELKIHP